MIKRALISVSDKTGIVPFAKRLIANHIEIISTGGTYNVLKEAGLEVIKIEDITSFKECLDGRVKTLHPVVHAGILAQRNNKKHMDEIEALQIEPIDLVVINLYPFEETISKPKVDFEEAIENIDIGGPTMLRSAAKNYQDVTVVVSPEDYERVGEAIEKNGMTTENQRFDLSLKVFEHTAYYDGLIAQYLRSKRHVANHIESLPKKMVICCEKVQDLRYGENPFQKAQYYKTLGGYEGGLVNAKQLHGKALSYNNINDTNGAIGLIKEFAEKPTIVAVKHANPCGVGQSFDLSQAFDKAQSCDPKSIFGGIIASNRMIDEATAHKINAIFIEVVIAPSYSEKALDVLKQKKNIRVLQLDQLMTPIEENQLQIKGTLDGLLLQTEDVTEGYKNNASIEYLGFENVTDRYVSKQELEALLFNWKVCKHVKSNAIVIGNKEHTQGIGVGQVSRLFAVEDAVKNNLSSIKGSVLASDAFFPFPDALEVAIKEGITAVIQPGGSINDQKVIDLANAYGVAMIFTKKRHFKH